MCRHRRSLQRHAVRQKVTLAFLLALKDQIFSPCSHTRKKKQHKRTTRVLRRCYSTNQKRDKPHC
jgi:hypothetical protein